VFCGETGSQQIDRPNAFFQIATRMEREKDKRSELFL
jgi:hypothetical protein